MSEVPYAPEAERAIIGALLVNNSLWDDVRAIIDAEDFFVQDYARMFAYIGQEIAAGHRVDLLTMTEQGFDPAELTRLVSTGSAVMTDEYAHIVRDRSLRRLALSQASRLASAAYDMDEDVEEVLAGHISALRKVGKADEKVAIPVAKAAGEFLDHLTLLQQGVSQTIQTPWEEINTLIGGFVAPELIVLAARPSMGKSQWAVQVADSLRDRGLHVLFHDMETDSASILRRIALMRAGVNWMKFRLGIQTPDDIAAVAAETTRLTEAEGLWIVDKRMSVDKFRWIVRRMHREHGLDLLIVDYLQLYPTEGKNRVQEVGHVARTLKDIAKENHIPVLATCQLRRISGREDKKPTMEDLRESGEIEQAADLVIGMHRPAYYNPTLGAEDGSGPTSFTVLKARDGVRGTNTNLYWAASKLRFEGVQPGLRRVMRDLAPATQPKLELNQPETPDKWWEV